MCRPFMSVVLVFVMVVPNWAQEKARKGKSEGDSPPIRPKDIVALLDRYEKLPKPSTNPLAREKEEKARKEEWEKAFLGKPFEGIATVRRIEPQTKTKVVIRLDFPHANRDSYPIAATAADAEDPALLKLEEGQLVVVTGTVIRPETAGLFSLKGSRFRVIGKQEDERLLKIREKGLRDLWAYPPR